MQKQEIKQHVHHDESVLVVPRTSLFPHGAWQGLQRVDEASITQLILEKRTFLPRSIAEHDPAFKQIIPYLVFRYQNQYFLMQRRETASEARLKNCFSFGIGGHIRAEDMQTASIADWAQREFREEIEYEGTITLSLLGVLNDDSNEVGKVHAGFVYLLEGDSSTIAVKEELKCGSLYTLAECAEHYPHMESWSQLVFDYLKAL
ncbi:MAG: hypothetical protein UV38_C0003G0135 [candidate division TM6 bacterium GW2011_GWE2_42_60]|nr:MAG: hypothetical protein UV38_C0003G0135 [candidate division TM6 bacterium GW2011_GWE2_42_60]HBY05386.1 hypothetical protein [Candidatus Dependentiae bacterium]